MLFKNYALLRQSRSRAFAQNGTYFIVRRFSSNVPRRQSRRGTLEEKTEGIKRRAALLTSLFLKLFAYFSSIPNARTAGVGDLGKWRLAL